MEVVNAALVNIHQGRVLDIRNFRSLAKNIFRILFSNAIQNRPRIQQFPLEKMQNSLGNGTA